ncbi:hypothetical protein [Streptomyces sp. NBC_01304]|uniref:hypothetical protein n=1 Tax=Streptomyces sp. NBC_01304 TaxID=2903818 RepID=UPI002E0FBEF0|nr:hypothetical protein OG430_02070 [Streptomyces sp. NBC_01304]
MPAASAHDSAAAGRALLGQAAEQCGNRLVRALVDRESKGEDVIHGAMVDSTVGGVSRNLADHGKDQAS